MKTNISKINLNNSKSKTNINKTKIKKFLIGNNGDGLLQKLVIYAFLIIVSFVFLYPLLYMISYSLKSIEDIINPLINWVPSKFYTQNYDQAIKVLSFVPSLITTIYVSCIPAIIQMIVCSIIGYGFARFEFVGKNFIFALVLATFIIPPQITMIPQYLMYKDLGILGSLLAYILPALFGQGIRSSIFILIFYQFYKQLPKALEEAAEVDGAGYFAIFFKIAIPSAIPAYIIAFLFSLVWYWNETYLATMYFGTSIQTLPMKLGRFAATFKDLYPQTTNTGQTINEAIEMAGTCLNIFPLLIIYFFTQRWFVESVDRSGITGE